MITATLQNKLNRYVLAVPKWYRVRKNDVLINEFVTKTRLVTMAEIGFVVLHGVKLNKVKDIHLFLSKLFPDWDIETRQNIIGEFGCIGIKIPGTEYSIACFNTSAREHRGIFLYLSRNQYSVEVHEDGIYSDTEHRVKKPTDLEIEKFNEYLTGLGICQRCDQWMTCYY
jgi:hypothetical protein